MTDFVFDLGARLVEGFALLGLYLVGDEDVIAIGPFNRVGDFTLLECEHGLLHGQGQRAPLDPAQAAAFARRAGILRFLAGQIGKAGRLCARPGDDIFRLGQGVLGHIIRSARRQLDQDVADIDAGRDHVAGLVLLVVILELGFFDRRHAGQCGGLVEHQIIGGNLFGQTQRVLVSVIPGLDVRIRDLHVLGMVGGIEDPQTDGARFRQGTFECIEHRRRQAGCITHGSQHTVQRQLGTLTSFEIARRHAIRGQHLVIAIGGELSIDLQLRHGGNRPAQRSIGHAEMLVGRHRDLQLAVDQLVQQGLTRLRIVQQGRIEPALAAFLHLLQLVALSLNKFFLCHRVPANFDDGRIGRDEGIAADAEEHEGRHDQNQKKQLHQALMRTNEIEHERLTCWRLTAPGPYERNVPQFTTVGAW